ncbi:hypothetical protein [Kribbella sp. CA-293567]|uniref:hypothetical protein n=1 Tax=Kribbella sp. CA-293567 TaxID=3002436 RepID=UPI0022DDCF86|nr:hypothetical protein [Kribbella sp. CA-293567]WBQ05405.1 hypothetical protein OX958_01075 [Kribbella sp. CA-293567]
MTDSLLAGRRSRRTGALLALSVAAVALLAPAAQANAVEFDPDDASATMQRGTGTLTDPWVPMLSARTTCDSTTLFGNYSSSTGHRDPIVTLPAGTWMGVRYLVRGGYSANVLWHGGDKWGFMRDDCISY